MTDLVSVVMVKKAVEDNSISLQFEHKDKRADMDTLAAAKAVPKVLEVPDFVFIQCGDLGYLLADGREKDRVFFLQPVKDFIDICGVDVHVSRTSQQVMGRCRVCEAEKKRTDNDHNYCYCELFDGQNRFLNSSMVCGLSLPDFSSLAVFSMDCITSFAISSLTSLESSSSISESSLTFLSDLSSFTSSSVSENALRATEDQLIQSAWSISDLRLSGTDSVIVPIFNLQYVYPLYTKEIFKVCDLDLERSYLVSEGIHYGLPSDRFFMKLRRRDFQEIRLSGVWIGKGRLIWGVGGIGVNEYQ